jgi:hypothetical protein
VKFWKGFTEAFNSEFLGGLIAVYLMAAVATAVVVGVSYLAAYGNPFKRKARP